MKKFNVTFERRRDSCAGPKKEIRRVTDVPAKTEDTAKNKAFRRICFATKKDDWKFKKIEEAKDSEAAA